MPDHRRCFYSFTGVAEKKEDAWNRDAEILCVMAPRSLPSGQACSDSREDSPPLRSARPLK